MTNIDMIDVEYRKIGPTTLGVWQTELARIGSPYLPHVEAMYTAAGEHSALCLAQMYEENRYGTTSSILKPKDNNPLSLRPWAADPRSRREIGATNINILSPNGGRFLTFVTPAAGIYEWRRRLFDDPFYKNGVYTGAHGLRDMLNIYAPPGDIHPVTGIDNADSGYYDTVVTMLKRFSFLEETSVPTTTPTTTRQQVIVLSAGHRNTNRGGARGEIDWTPGCVRILAEEFRKSGAKVYIVQEEDGDADKLFTNRPLGAIGQIAAAIDKKYGPIAAFISCHYNGGGTRGFHIIPPDSGGLRNGGTGIPVTNDGKETNGRDWRVARNIRDRLLKSKTVPQIAWPAEKGVMSEKETGVGSNGWRLAELQESIPVKSHAVRLIVEAGSIDTADRVYISDPEWVRNVYCRAIVDGLVDEIGPLGPTTTVPPVTPELPVPPDPADTGYVLGQAIKALDDAEQVNDNTDTMVSYVTTDTHTWVWIGDQVEAIRKTPRFATLKLDDDRTGADIEPPLKFRVNWFGVPHEASKPLVYRTDWHTLVIANDVKRVSDDPGPGRG